MLGIAFCVPALAGLGVFVIFPLAQAIFLSTRGTDINGNPTRSVGAANFAASQNGVAPFQFAVSAYSCPYLLTGFPLVSFTFGLAPCATRRQQHARH